MTEGGEVALIVDYNSEENHVEIKGYSLPKSKKFTLKEKRNAYIADAVNHSDVPDESRAKISNFLLGTYQKRNCELNDGLVASVFATKKYKPVALKVKPVYTELPDYYRIKRTITGDPLKDMPVLSAHPPEFVPTGRYTQERKEIIDNVHKGDFLWPEERKLVHHLMAEQNQAFAWDDSERGRFRTDFFPPVVMPTIEHKPWVY